MSITLRCRGPNGQATLSGVAHDMPTAAFLEMLAEKTGVPAGALEILSGFPPKLLQLTATGGTVADLGLVNGDTLTVRQGALAAPPASATEAAPPAAIREPQGPSVPAQPTTQVNASAGAASRSSFDAMDEDEMLARAIAASLQEQPQPGASGTGVAAVMGGNGARGPSPGSRHVSNADPAASKGAPSSVPVPGGDGSRLVRRVIDSDNSCLFNAVGYVVERTRSRARELRKVIADCVAADPVTYNEGFLGKDNAEYCRWIQGMDKWGGAIELYILAQHYGREIAAYDIRTKRCDVYGQGNGYPDRSLVIYDGLHYDALAVEAFEGAPEELDVTAFEPGSQAGSRIQQAAEQLVAACNAARQFTDTANFTLRCGVCQIGLKGEKEAVEHAKATGHSNFAEY